MKRHALKQLSGPVIVREFTLLLAQDRDTGAQLLEYLGERCARRLHLPAGYSTMFEYCTCEFHMSEDVAYRRLRAAQAARKFPVVLDALADGRLHVAAVSLLSRHLTRENVAELLQAATHKSKRQVEKLIADRFPRPEVPTFVRQIEALGTAGLQPETALAGMAPLSFTSLGPVAPGPLDPFAQPKTAASMEPHAPQPKPTSLSKDNYATQFNMSQATHDQLRYAQDLLGHSMPSGDVARVFALALDALVDQLERRKFAKASLKRPSPGSRNPRYIPAEVRRTVWQRDGGRCAFVSDQGHRCEERSSVEFDHFVPVARGGEATVANVRVCCRAHNQYEAERVLGADYMRGKREAAHASSASAAKLGLPQDLVPRLRELGLSEKQAAQAAAQCANYSGMPFEERLTLALRGVAAASVHIIAHAASSPA